MFKVLACLRDQHDYRLVLLAVLICAVASFTAFHIYANAKDSQGGKRLGWIFLTGVATGAGIWATHFVAMLAFKTGLPTAYDPALTLASLLIAISVTAAGFLHRRDVAKSPLLPAIGGVVIGSGHRHHALYRHVGLSHDWNDQLGSPNSYSPRLYSASCSALPRFSAFRSRSRIRLIAATSLLTIAICSLHFTAMGAAIVTPDPTIVVYPSFMDNTTMAFAVAGVTLLVMLAGLAAALIEKADRTGVRGPLAPSWPTRPPRELSSPRTARS